MVCSLSTFIEHFIFLFRRNLLVTLFGMIRLCVYSQDQASSKIIDHIVKNEEKYKNKGDLYLSIADECDKAFKFPQAIEYYKKASAEFLKDNNLMKVAEASRKVGKVYSEINDYSQSLQNYLITLELYEQLKIDSEIVSTVSDIGEVHLKYDNYSKALEYLFRANKLCLKDTIKYKKRLRNNNMLLGVSYGSINNVDSSLFYFNKVLAQTDSIGEELDYAGLLNNIGAIYSKRKENSKALEYYYKALSIFRKIINERGIGIALSNIAYISKKEGKNTKAINFYTEAITYLKRGHELGSLADSYINLSDVYKEINEYKLALSYSQKYIELNDTLNNTELLNEVANLEMQQEIRKKDQEIKILDQQKQLFEKDIKLKKMWFYIVGITMFLLALIGYLILRGLRISLKNNQLKQELLNKEKVQLTGDLEYKSKELEKFAFHIIEKNELLGQLKNELKDLSTHQESDNTRVREISSTITNNLLIEKDRKEFEFQLDKIQESFFLKLNNLHPDLTKNERRLCSLIIMGLSSKDIATILNVSPDGVKKSRYRLRKKLNLFENANIAEYLMKI